MTIDWWTLALQTINFLVVVWLLSRFLYRPIKRVIEQREAADQSAAAAAQHKQESAEALRKEYEEKIADISKTLREEETKLHAAMEDERQKTLDVAAAETEKMISDARAQMKTERRHALDNLQSQIADLARSLAVKALRDVTDPASDAMQARVGEYLDGLPDGELSDLRSDVSAASDGISVVTATELPDDAQAKWQAFLNAHLGEASVTFETDPEILGGIEFHFPHARLNFSVGARLNQAMAETKG